MNTRGVRIALLSSLIAALTGCATGPPTAEELAAADYGNAISQARAETAAKVWLDNYLKDPGSAQMRWGPVSENWIRAAPIHGGGLLFGYRLDGEINAKNSFGGYTGFKQYWFMFRNGELVSVYGEQELEGSYGSYMGKLF